MGFRSFILLVLCESHTYISIVLSGLVSAFESFTIYGVLTHQQAGRLRSKTAVPTYHKPAEYFTAGYQRSSLATPWRSTAECGAPGQKHQILLRPFLQRVPGDQCTSNQRSLTPQAPDEVITLLILLSVQLEDLLVPP